MAEKFLILGASSFYGKNFAELVRQRGDEAVCQSRPEFDIEDPACYPQAAERADYIVNFISRSLVAESWDKPGDWMFTNVEATTGLIQWLVRHGQFRKFVHVSTPEVYGSNDWWVEEDQPFNPTTPYAVSRAAGDMMLKAYQRALGFPMVITRTANIYGPGQPEHRIIPQAIAYKRAGKVLQLHGDGHSVRSFIHVKDACAATYLVAKSGVIGETYHISCRPAQTIKQVVQKIGCKYQPAPERLGKDYAYLLESEKVRALGWEDRIPFEEGLKQCELST